MKYTTTPQIEKVNIFIRNYAKIVSNRRNLMEKRKPGRPKGSRNRKTIEKMKTGEFFDNPNRDRSGKFLEGNNVTRKKAYDVEELRYAIQNVETRRGKDLLEHFIDRAYKSDTVLIELLRKFVPNISVTDLKNTANPFNVFLTQFINRESLPKEDLKTIDTVTVEDKNEE